MRRLALAVLLVACGGEVPSVPEDVPCASLRHCEECAQRWDCVWCSSWNSCAAEGALCAAQVRPINYCPATP